MGNIPIFLLSYDFQYSSKICILLYQAPPLRIRLSILICLLLQLITDNASSQTCIPFYRNTYGGTGNDETLDIIVTADKGSIVVGKTTSGTAGDYDFILSLNYGTLLPIHHFDSVN